MELMKTKSKMRIFSVIRIGIGSSADRGMIGPSDSGFQSPDDPMVRSPDAVQNAPSCVKLKPGKVTPSGNFATFTFTTGALGAVTSAGRSTAYCVKTSLYTLVTR